MYNSLLNNSVISQKTFFYIYERQSRPLKRYLEVENLHVNLSHLMKDSELYSSPLTFDNVDCYQKTRFQLKTCEDIRETKMSHSSFSSIGQVHEVGRVTRGYISNRVISLSKTTSFFNTN